MSDNLTTAKALGSFRKELIAEDVPTELADDIVRIIARDLVDATGLGVKA